jgi:hypothetical protein
MGRAASRARSTALTSGLSVRSRLMCPVPTVTVGVDAPEPRALAGSDSTSGSLLATGVAGTEVVAAGDVGVGAAAVAAAVAAEALALGTDITHSNLPGKTR